MGNADPRQLLRHPGLQSVFRGNSFHQITQREIIPASCFLIQYITGLLFRIHGGSGSINLDPPRRAAAAHAAHHKPALVHQITVKPQRHPQTRPLCWQGQCFRKQRDFQFIRPGGGSAVIRQGDIHKITGQHPRDIPPFSCHPIRRAEFPDGRGNGFLFFLTVQGRLIRSIYRLQLF